MCLTPQLPYSQSGTGRGIKMYYWRTDLLTEDLRTNKVSEKDKCLYYILTSVLIILAMWSLEAGDQPVTMLVHLNYVLELILTTGGLWYVFKAYRPKSLFVERAVAISFPLTIKVLLLTILAILPFQVLMELGKLPESIIFEIVILNIAILFFYIRLGHFLKKFTENE